MNLLTGFSLSTRKHACWLPGVYHTIMYIFNMMHMLHRYLRNAK